MSDLNTGYSYLVKDEDFKFIEDEYGYEVEDKGKGYFKYIGSEKVVEIPHIIQGHEMTSYYKMFYNTSVEKVISTNKNITNMRCMFQEVKTDKLDLYGLDTSNVINMSYMFSCISVNKLDLYNFNTSNVTNMGGMFISSKIKKLNVSSFNTSNVTSMWLMFGSSKATKLDLSSFDTSRVTAMFGMFEYSSVTELDLSSFDTSNVSSMEWMFSGASTTIVYVRTQKDANRFNKISEKPKNLTFVVKSKDK